MNRVQPAAPRTGLFGWSLAQAASRVTRTEPMKLFLTMGRAPGLFRGWLHFAGKLMPRGHLPRRDTELVILRVAHVRGCDYEYQHHLALGRRVGLSSVDLQRVVVGPGAEGWSARERALLVAVDALLADRDLSDSHWAQLRANLDERDAVEFVLLVAHYDMLATFINTMRLTPDQPR